MNLQEKIGSDFRIDYSRKLGSGAFGDVFKGTWISRNCYVAMKRIKESIVNAQQMIEEETKIMSKFEDKNILKILDVVRENNATYLIIQFCEGGNLEQEIRKGIPEGNCLVFLKQIVDGMDAVNKKLHIHRDLKPENILFTNEKVLKICDFGLARKITGDDPNQISKFSAKGTPLYSSPQVLRHQLYSAKCDVWSAGVVLVEMLTRRNPFQQAKNLASLMNLQQQLEKNPYVLQGQFNVWFKDVLSHMLAYDEATRWSFSDLKKHMDKTFQPLLNTLGHFQSLPGTTTTQQNTNQGGTTLYVDYTKNIQQKTKKQNTNPQPHGGVISRQQQKLSIREENKKLLTGLKHYIEYLYNRGKLFADIGTKYFSTKEVPKPNGYKFMVLFMSISVFIKSIEKIFHMISKEASVTLPDNTKIVYEALDNESVKDYQAVRKDYQNQMKEEINKFSATIAQIEAKMFSEKYMKEYPELMQNHKDILEHLKQMKNNTCTKTVEFFEGIFKSFFKKECLEKNPKDLHEGYLRIYYVCMKLVHLEESLPLSKFRDSYIINQIIDDSSKLPINKIRSEVEILNQKL